MVVSLQHYQRMQTQGRMGLRTLARVFSIYEVDSS